MRAGRTPKSEKRDREAHYARTKKREEEPRVDYRDIDGLHGSYSLVCRQLTEGSHYESREGEEDSRNQAGTQHCGEGQDFHELLHFWLTQIPEAAVAKIIKLLLSLLA